MIRILDPTTMREPQGVRFDPVILKWAPPPHNTVNLNEQDFDFIDVVEIIQTRNVVRINPLERYLAQPPRGLTFDIPRGTYLLDVSVFAENAEPIQRRYRLSCGAAWDAIRLEEIARTISDS